MHGTVSEKMFFCLVKPLKVEILDKEKHRVLSANKEYEIDCKAEGSQPRANITWILGEKRIEHLALKVCTRFNFICRKKI